MRVEILTVDDCPNAKAARAQIQEALRLESVRAPVEVVEVASADAAHRTRFLGSPSIRIDGKDVEREARGRDGFGLMCRTYDAGINPAGVPPLEMIRAAIRDRDILRNPRLTGLLFWLPALAMVASGSGGIGVGWRTAIWSVALATMGIACVVNASRCGRLHCYFTGPFFLIMSLATLAYGFGLLPLGAHGWSTLSAAVALGAVLLCYLPEAIAKAPR